MKNGSIKKLIVIVPTIDEGVMSIGIGAFSQCSGSLTAICGKSGSYVEAYAAEHGYAFEEK